MHQVFGMILNAITVGVIFSRVSFPQQRGRTIAISDSAVIARRDGILKFMFRIADIRKSQVRAAANLCCIALAPLLCLIRASRFAGSHVQHYLNQ